MAKVFTLHQNSDILDVDTTNGEVHSTVCSTLPIVQEKPKRMETELRHLFVYFHSCESLPLRFPGYIKESFSEQQ